MFDRGTAHCCQLKNSLRPFRANFQRIIIYTGFHPVLMLMPFQGWYFANEYALKGHLALAQGIALRRMRY